MTKIEYYSSLLEMIKLFESSHGQMVLNNFKEGSYFLPIQNEHDLWKNQGVREFISGIYRQIEDKGNIEKRLNEELENRGR